MSVYVVCLCTRTRTWAHSIDQLACRDAWQNDPIRGSQPPRDDRHVAELLPHAVRTYGSPTSTAAVGNHSACGHRASSNAHSLYSFPAGSAPFHADSPCSEAVESGRSGGARAINASHNFTQALALEDQMKSLKSDIDQVCSVAAHLLPTSWSMCPIVPYSTVLFLQGSQTWQTC
jgi:hypothetical protein